MINIESSRLNNAQIVLYDGTTFKYTQHRIVALVYQLLGYEIYHRGSSPDKMETDLHSWQEMFPDRQRTELRYANAIFRALGSQMRGKIPLQTLKMMSLELVEQATSEEEKEWIEKIASRDEKAISEFADSYARVFKD